MKNKTVLITGASSGFGYEFVKLCAKDNYDMILVARNTEKLNEIKQTYSQVKITVIGKDLTQKNAVTEIIEEIKAKKLTVDILINNAGFGLSGAFDHLDINEQLNMIQLNISALTELTYYIVKDMKTRREGRVLNVASMAAFQPGPYMAVYFATKAYVLSLSEALVEELKKFNITITTLCPGAAETNFGKVANVENTKMFKSAMDAKKVAVIGYKALIKGKRIVIPGGTNKAAAYTSKLLPRSFVTKIVKSVIKSKD